MPKQFWRTLAVMAIVGAIWYLEAEKPVQLSSSAPDIVLPTIIPTGTISSSTPPNTAPLDRSVMLKKKSAQYPRAKELADIQGYINTPEFKLGDVVGKKVILVDFWTYSCINCQRTTPYLNSWYEKYKDKGFVIVGVHTPEFDFEKNYQNVQNAVTSADIKYPVVLDNSYGTWNAYSNRFWPHEFLIDIDGYVVEDRIGEGGYDQTEAKIQELLKERAQVLGVEVSVNEKITASKADDIETQSPETYFGSHRNAYLGNGTVGLSGEQSFLLPGTIELNKLYLGGTWNIMGEYAEAGAGSTATYRYQAKRLYFVAGSAKPIDVEVLRDGKPIDPSVKGRDIFYKDGKSYVHIMSTTLYKIIEDSAFGEHVLQFVISATGLQAFTFTFG